MNPRRRLRSLRENAWWLSAQNIFHIVAVGIVVGIVLFEDSVKDASMASQQLLQSLPSTEIASESSETFFTREAPPGTILAPLREVTDEQNHEVKVQGAATRKQDVYGPVKTTSVRHSMDKSLVEKLQSIQNATEEMKTDATVQDLVKLNKAAMHKQNGTVTTRGRVLNLAQRTNATDTEQIKLSNKTGIVSTSSVNMADFHRHAEERTIENALKKRAALESVKDMKWGNETNVNTFLNVIVNGTFNETNKMNNSYPHVNVYKGVQKMSDNSNLFKADNITHLSYMLYRLIKTHGIVSLIDVPCTLSIFWIPELIQRLEFEVPKFHYRCIVPDDELLVDAVLRFQGLSSAVVIKDPAFWTSKLPAADLAFVWYGLGFMAPKPSWQLLKALQQSPTKYVIVPNHPDVVRNPGVATPHGRVNVRRAPYLFDEALRVVNNVSSTQSRKQLLMYDLKGVRSGIL